MISELVKRFFKTRNPPLETVLGTHAFLVTAYIVYHLWLQNNGGW